MKLYGVILPVSNIERAAEFYAQVLGTSGERISPGRHYFDCEGTIVACYDPRADGDDEEAQPNPGHLYFAVDDLDQVYAGARDAGATLPDEEPPGAGPLGRAQLLCRRSLRQPPLLRRPPHRHHRRINRE